MTIRFLMRKFKFGFLAFLFLYLFLVIVKLCCQEKAVKWSTAVSDRSNPERAVDTGFYNISKIRPQNGDPVIPQTEGTFNVLKCPEKSPQLRERIADINVNNTILDLTLSEEFGGEVMKGGTWRPLNCTARKKVAFLIPFRNRTEQLNVFLNHMHSVFQRQQLNYRVFVIEQVGTEQFNKGAIYNIGFNESLSYDDYDCHIFHDVDLLSETDTNDYGCPHSPMHLSVGIDKFNYKLSYAELIGGIQLFSKEHYKLINGYSNKFWGWGGEDDNLYTRIKAKGLKLVRPSTDVARYKMNQNYHFRSDGWSKANQVLIYHRRPRQDIDGLNSINKLNFSIVAKEDLLYTLISIDLHRI